MADEQGQVKINIEVDTSKAKSDIKALAEATGQDATKIEKALGDAYKEAGKEAAKLGDKKATPKMDADDTKLKQATKEAKSELDGVEKTKTTAKIGADAESVKQTTAQARKQLEAIPKSVKTSLIADAKDHGITNFQKILKQLPEKKQVELLAKYQKHGVLDYEQELRRLPAKVVTQIKLDNKATLGLQELKHQASEVKSSFSRLKTFIAGTAIGQVAAAGFQALTGSIKAAISAGMEYNKQQDTMRTVWHSLTTKAPKDGEELINTINELSQHSIYSADAINEMAQSFYHVGSSTKDTKRWLNDFLAVGSTMHMTNEALSESAEMFAKIEAGGKASAEDISVMINRFPMFGEALQEVTHKSMKDIYKLTSAGKLPASVIGKAMDEVGKKYKSGTEEAMTSMMGMGMYIKNRWTTLWGDITKQSFNMNKQTRAVMRDLLSDDAMKSYAAGISRAVGDVMSIFVKLISYLNDHKKTIMDIFNNLYKIGKIIAETVWTTFSNIIKTIGTLLGALSGNASKSTDALQSLDNILKFISDHAEAVAKVTRVILALWTINKFNQLTSGLKSWATGLRDVAKANKEVAASEALSSAASGGGGSVGGGYDLTDLISGEKKLSRTASKSGKSRGLFSRLFKRGGSAAEEVSTLSRTASRGGRFSRLLSGSKSLLKVGLKGAKATVGLNAVSSIMDGLGTYGNTSKGWGITGGGLAGGAAGAAIGTMIFPGIGTWAGGLFGNWLGEKLGSSKNVQNALKKIGEAFTGKSLNFKPKVKVSELEVDTSKIGKLNRSTLQKLNANVFVHYATDKKSLKDTQKQSNSLVNTLKSNVDKYYKHKESEAEKNMKKNIKNGSMTKKDAEKQLSDLKKRDAKAAAEQKKLYDQIGKYANKASGSLSKAFAKGVSSKDRQKALKQYKKDVNSMVKAEFDAQSNIKKSVKRGSNEQLQLLENLRKRKKTLSVKQIKEADESSKKIYENAVKPARKQRDDVIKAANEQYDKVVKDAKEARDKHHTMTKQQYDDAVKKAKEQRDDVTDAANKQYRNTTKSARDQRDKVTKEMEIQKGYVLEKGQEQKNKRTKQADDEARQTYKNYRKGNEKLGSMVDAVMKFFQKLLNAIGIEWKYTGFPGGFSAYAKGTSGLSHDEVALVGEEGFELAHTPGLGIYPIGVNSPEIRPLKAGTSILPHEQSKQFLAMAKGLPAHKDGVSGFISSVWNGAKSAWDWTKKAAKGVSDFISKGAKAAVNGVVKMLGVDKIWGDMSGMVKKTLKGGWDFGIKGFTKWLQSQFDKSDAGDGGGSVGNPKGSGVMRWKPYVIRALKANKFEATPYQVSAWLKVIARESGGNPSAVNNWDSNAKAGIPSKGLVQTIEPTFNAFKFKGHGNILNGYDNLLAGINYMAHRYGRGNSAFARVSGPMGYATGGHVFGRELAWVGEDGEEFIINPKKDNADGLITAAAKARANHRPGLANAISAAKAQSVNMLKLTPSHAPSQKAATLDTSALESKLDKLISQPTTFVGEVDGKQLFKVVSDQQNRKRTINQLFKGITPTTAYN